MHILFVAKHYFGNPDMVRLCTELAQRKHRISVATSFRSVDKRTWDGNINVFEISPWIRVQSLGYPISLPFSKIYEIVREQGVEIIHALGDLSINTVSAALASRITNVPFVYIIQGMAARTDNPLVDALVELYDRTIERLVAGTARRVVLQSKRLMPRATKLGVKKSNVITIPAGVDTSYFDPERLEVKKKATTLRNELHIGRNETVIGFVGRLFPIKGLPYLISAVRQIEHEHPDIVLLIVGDGPQRADLEMMAKDLKAKTIFAGWQAETSLFYALMDIFVLPSLFEGLPNVILEAMAMKKAVVATTTGGNVDLVVDGKNGFLVPTRDDRRMAFALRKLIENGDMRRQMGEINRQMVEENYRWDVVVPKVEELYRTMKTG